MSSIFFGKVADVKMNSSCEKVWMAWVSIIASQRIQEHAIQRSHEGDMTGFISGYWVYLKLCKWIVSVEWMSGFCSPPLGDICERG